MTDLTRPEPVDEPLSPPAPDPVTDVLLALLRDVLPSAGHVLVLDEDPRVVQTVAAQVTSIVTLRRTTSEEPMTHWATVKDLAAMPHASCDAIVALGGIPPGGGIGESWDERLTAVTSLIRPGGALVIGVQDGGGLRSALQPSPAAARDPSLPASTHQLLTALIAAGLPRPSVHAVFGHQAPVAMETSVAARLRDGDAMSDFVTASLSPALADVSSGMALAGLLAELATSWVAVSPAAGRSVYVQSPASVAVLAGGPTDTGWVLRSADVQDGAVPIVVGSGPSLAHELRAALSADDLTRVRELCRSYADYSRSKGRSAGPPHEVYVDGANLTAGLMSSGGGHDHAEPAGRAGSAHQRLAQAWLDFDDRDAGVRATWDQLSDRRSRVLRLLAFSGVPAPDRVLDSLERGRLPMTDGRIAAVASDEVSGVPARAVIPAPSREEIQGDNASIRALRRAVQVRDEQLRHREAHIRDLRHRWLTAQRVSDDSDRAVAAVRSSHTYRTGQRVEQLRDPRRSASAVARRAASIARRVLPSVPVATLEPWRRSRAWWRGRR